MENTFPKQLKNVCRFQSDLIYYLLLLVEKRYACECLWENISNDNMIYFVYRPH